MLSLIEHLAGAAIDTQAFNIVIEGAFSFPSPEHRYKIVHLFIPQKTTLIDDREYRYPLYAHTENFRNYSQVREPLHHLAFCTAPFSQREGVHIQESASSLSSPLKHPRTIITNNGRIYVRPDMIQLPLYLKEMPTILQIAQTYFTDSELQRSFCDTLQINKALILN